MKFQLPQPTWKEAYAHFLLLSFYFIFVGVIVNLFSKFFWGDLSVLTTEDIKFICSVFILAIFLLPLLHKTYPELKHWFKAYFMIMFILRFFFF